MRSRTWFFFSSVVHSSLLSVCRLLGRDTCHCLLYISLLLGVAVKAVSECGTLSREGCYHIDSCELPDKTGLNKPQPIRLCARDEMAYLRRIFSKRKFSMSISRKMSRVSTNASCLARACVRQDNMDTCPASGAV